jgi:hypothetical protein
VELFGMDAKAVTPDTTNTAQVMAARTLDRRLLRSAMVRIPFRPCLSPRGWAGPPDTFAAKPVALLHTRPL